MEDFHGAGHSQVFAGVIDHFHVIRHLLNLQTVNAYDAPRTSTG
jgi:hypothetical protein